MTRKKSDIAPDLEIKTEKSELCITTTEFKQFICPESKELRDKFTTGHGKNEII